MELRNVAAQMPAISDVVLSVVSHGQLALIRNLFGDLRGVNLIGVRILLTLNIPEDEAAIDDFADLPIEVIRNKSPKGFGENHNYAFLSSPCSYFVIVNPDIRLHDFDMQCLLLTFASSDVGAVAPVVFGPGGSVEDSVRRFPTPRALAVRLLSRERGPDYEWAAAPIDVDWAAGMFVVFKSQAFSQVGGFDSRYFMYMEDADICMRLKDAGWRTVLQPRAAVVHDAQRASRRSLRHLRWHVASAFRFLFLSRSRSSS